MMYRLLIAAVAMASWAFAQETPIHIVNLPDRALVPDAVVDSKGTAHIVYGLGDKAWYVRSADNGKTLYKSDGTFTGRQATLGTTTSGTKPTAFLCPDGSFTILTTAKQSEKPQQ